LITSAAAAKIYRSNGLESQQNIDIKLELGANLEMATPGNNSFLTAQFIGKICG
jgi:UreD urease accessory protein.